MAPPATPTMALIRIEARPVTVMQPAIRPAMAQATATETALLAPACRASKAVASENLVVSTTTLMTLLPASRSRSEVSKKLMKPMMKAPIIEMAAEVAMVRAPVATSHTSSTSGSTR